MEFGLLGPLEVRRDGVALPLGGPKQRAVLALLLLRRGSSVPADVLIDEIWGETPPQTARNALQGYVFQLRKVLEPDVLRGGAHSVIISDGAGYRLDCAADDVDVERFDRRVTEGENLAATSPSAAVARFDEALALWRGPPLADLAFEPFARGEVHRLEERRLAAQEARMDAVLAAGRHADAVADLEALVDEHPLRERLHRQLLLALYRCGRQSDALAAYARARELLVEQLGIEPGPELRDLHVAVLKQDPSLAPPPVREPVGFRPPPRPPTRLIGREREQQEIGQLLHDHHVVTLLGPGGAGKTRLALAVAEQAGVEYPDGVAWVELETIRDPELVLNEIAATGSLGDIAADLEGRRALLVLDNLEQVLGCAAALATFVEQLPDLRLLVTSREPLNVAAERRYHVPLLEPAAAVELFLDRAEAVGVSLTEGDGAVEDVCRRLEGLPLALELAAAQTTVFAPADLLSRLETPDVFTSARRDVPDRHRTLDAAIQWSHSLLDETQRAAYARLGIFSGSWTLDAAESVAGADARLVESLVAKNLVRREDGRFAMLDTIRRDARGRLEESGDATRLARDHAEFVAVLVGRLDAERPAGWLLALDREHANVRAALDSAVSAGDAELALALASAARTFWEARGHIDEGVRRLEDALELPGASDGLRIRGLYAAGILHARALRYEEAERLHSEAVALCRATGDEQALARALNSLGIALYHLGRLDESEAVLAESLAVKQRLGDERGAAIALLSLGNTALAAGDLVAAEQHQRTALDTLRKVGDELGVATALDDLASLRILAGDSEGAVVLLVESLAVSRRLGALANVACALVHLGHVLVPTDREQARSALVEALTLFGSLSEPEGVVGAVEAFAAWWLDEDPRRSAALVGAADARRIRLGVEPDLVEGRLLEAVRRGGIETLGETAWDVAVAHGRAVHMVAASELALEAPPSRVAEFRP